MYSADADIFFFNFFFLHTKIYGPNWSETQSQTAWVTPPRIMILWRRSIESIGTYINKNIHYL